MFVRVLVLALFPNNTVRTTRTNHTGIDTMSTVGYARVSTTDQDLSIQRQQLANAGCNKVYEEKESGARGDRPQLTAMLGYVRDGDVLVVAKLDRLARSMVHFWRIWQQLEA